MQTFTHAVVGVALGSLLFPESPVLTACLVFGSVAPDLVLVPEFIIDKLAGRVPFSGELGFMRKFFLKPSHSMVLWSLLVWLGWIISQPLWVLAIGGVLHLFIDLCSHGDPEMNRRDPPYLWPITKQKLHVGNWEYRIAVGQLWPVKPFEAFVIFVSVLVLTFKWCGGL